MSVSTEQSSDSPILAPSSANPVAPTPLIDIAVFRKSQRGIEVASWVKRHFAKCRNLRTREEKQWNLNLSMYMGNQWVQPVQYKSDFDGFVTQLATPLGAKGKERQTINRIRPVCRTEMSKFLSRRPGASVIPSTSDDDDRSAAEAGEQVWTSTMERRDLDKELSDAIFWKVITGNGFIKVYWDESTYDKDGQVYGDVVYGAVDPYKLFFPDLMETEIQRQAYIFHAYAKPTEWCNMNYEQELKGVTLAPTCKESESIMSNAFADPRKNNEKDYDANMIYELWIKPGSWKGMPLGGRVVMIEQTIVAFDEAGLPYDHGDYPFAHFGHIMTGRFYRASIIEDLVDLQRDYNALRSQIAESRKKMAKPQLTAAKGSVVASKMTNEIGLLIEYRAGHQAPQPMPMQPIPQYVLQEVDLILRDMEDISGQHQVTKGTVPPGVTAAAAISYLQEADDTYLFTSYSSLEEAYEDIARQTLSLTVQYWDMPRKVKVCGDDQAFDWLMLSGADIKNGTDIRIEKGSALPQSKAAKQALVMDLMTNGFITPQDGLDIMEIGGAKSVVDKIQNDKRQASRENIQFKLLTDQMFMQADQQWQMKQMQAMMAQQQGDPNAADALIDPQTGMPVQQPLIIPVNSFDNHQIHIEEHNRFRRSQAYHKLTEQAKTAMESHVEMHKSTMQSDLLQQTLSQIPTDGSVPGVSGIVSGGQQPNVDPQALAAMDQQQQQGGPPSSGPPTDQGQPPSGGPPNG